MNHPDRLKISKEFHINGAGEWLSLEYPLSPEDNVHECFSKARAILIAEANNAAGFTDFNTGQGMNVYAPAAVPVINRAAELVKDLIDEAATIKQLEDQRASAEKYNLMDQWNNKFKEINNVATINLK